MARSRSSGGRSSSPAPSRSYSSSSSASSNTATRGNPTQHNKPVAHPPAAASSAAPAHHAAPASAPGHPQQHAPAPAQGGGMLSGLAGTMMSGMAFGTGSAVAHRAIDGIMGPREVQHTHNNAPAAGEAASSSSARNPCEQQNKLFMSCMKDNSGSIASCQSYFDSLSQCQREQPQMN